MLPEFLNLGTIYLIAHVFGAILGAGGAFMSDAMFFSSIRDGFFDQHEFRFMKLGGKMVWTGIFILVISGILLVSTNPEYYLSSSKFLVKVSIVGIIIANGVIFHLVHLPHIKRHLNIKFSESETFVKNASFLMMSGAVSMVSWISTVILGMLKKVPYSYTEILSVYISLVLVAVTGSILIKKKLLDLK